MEIVRINKADLETAEFQLSGPVYVKDELDNGIFKSAASLIKWLTDERGFENYLGHLSIYKSKTELADIVIGDMSYHSGDKIVYIDYYVPAQFCGECDDLDITDGICTGHDDPSFVEIDFEGLRYAGAW